MKKQLLDQIAQPQVANGGLWWVPSSALYLRESEIPPESTIKIPAFSLGRCGFR